jgi:hypothetical protein
MNLTARHRLVKIGEDGGAPPRPPAYRLFTEEIINHDHAYRL